MDKLEKQIIEKRAELDRYVPDPDIWQRIQRDGRRIRYSKYRRISRWAAALILAITTSLVFISRGNNGLLSGTGSDSNPSQLLETEIYYQSKVNSLIDEARPILTEYPSISKDLMTEMENLDKLYLEVRKDLKDNVSNDDVIEALIRNYQAKVQILEEMLEILTEGETNNEKDANYEI